MDKGTKIISGTWSALAIVSMVGAFYAPLFWKITGIAFGILNLGVIVSMAIELFKKEKDEETL